MKQKRLITAIAAALAVSPLAVHAGLDLDDGAGVSTWASELKISDAGPRLLTGTGNVLSFGTKIGFGFPANYTGYARFDLSGGAKFAGAANPGCSFNNSASGASVSCSVHNGGKGQSFVVFSLTANDAADVAVNDRIDVSFAAADDGISLRGTSDITLTYTMHNDNASADEPLTSAASRKLYEKSQTYIKFTDTVSFTLTPETVPLTADVSAGFKKFKDDKVTGAIASFLYPDGDSTINTLTGTAPDFTTTTADLANVVSSAELILTGDFTALQDVDGAGQPLNTYDGATSKIFVADDDTCSSGSDFSAVTATEAKFTLTSAMPEEKYICLTVNTYTPINPTNFSAVVKFTPTETHAVADKSFAEAGRIVQNGTVVDTPYITLTPGYLSRVMFTNTGTSPAPYEAIVVTDDGATATLGAAGEGIIPAGANLQINASDLVGFSGKPRGAVRFIVDAPNTAIQGIYQTVNLNTGDAQSVLLNRSRGGDGRED